MSLFRVLSEFLCYTCFDGKLCIIIKRFSEFLLAMLYWFLLKFSWFIHVLHLKFPVQQYKPGQNFHQVINISILEWTCSSSAKFSRLRVFCSFLKMSQNALNCPKKSRVKKPFYEMMQYKDERRNSGARLLWSNSGPISINCLTLHFFFPVSLNLSFLIFQIRMMIKPISELL